MGLDIIKRGFNLSGKIFSNIIFVKTTHMTKTTRLLLLILLFSQAETFAQRASINGRITDSKTGDALNGASVRVKSSGAGTISDSTGSFNIDGIANDVLEITNIGYAPVFVKGRLREDGEIGAKHFIGNRFAPNSCLSSLSASTPSARLASAKSNQ